MSSIYRSGKGRRRLGQRGKAVQGWFRFDFLRFYFLASLRHLSIDRRAARVEQRTSWALTVRLLPFSLFQLLILHPRRQSRKRYDHSI
jgi:hypothetical protein